MSEKFKPPAETGPGRPEHVVTDENQELVAVMAALGWGQKRIAAVIGCSAPTLRRHYFPQLANQAGGRDRLVAVMMVKLLQLLKTGNVGAGRELRMLLEMNDAATDGQEVLGKKARAIHAASHPDTSSELGQLMARRMGLKSN